MAKLVSKTYGDALFELATDENKIDSLFEEAKALKEILDANDDFRKMMNHPQISREEKEKVMEDVFKGRASEEMTGFLRLLIVNGRFVEIDSILDYFIAEVKEFKKIGVAYVTTPLPLSDKQKSDVESKLLNTTSYETMEMNYSVDASLIGGMTIRIKDRVVDSSVKSKLDKLTKELLDLKLANA
ncbi:MAG: ATP synthase F1 subunit delta [Lachnospiraceae bacterium]|nr:ATP synthase F1 subunit delta [Lachnospiraceae bacterium]